MIKDKIKEMLERDIENCKYNNSDRASRRKIMFETRLIQHIETQKTERQRILDIIQTDKVLPKMWKWHIVNKIKTELEKSANTL